jgi:transposase
MARNASSRSSRSAKTYHLQKPNGQLASRVQAVGPERFGIIAVDAAKKRSRYFLADFYGNVLIPPTSVEHEHGQLQNAIGVLRTVLRSHGLRDAVVVIERTGEYHRPLQRAFRNADFETRIVHPFTSKQFRLPADPDNKTDDKDLGAIFRAATQGFGLIEPDCPEPYLSLQLLSRQRRDLVHKTSLLQCQIREVLHKAMPGLESQYSHLWQSPAPLAIARVLASAAEVLQAGYEGLERILHDAGVPRRKDSIHRILDWAQQAPPGHPLAQLHRRALIALDDDRREKNRLVEALERDLCSLAVTTPYALLLALPGINLVSVADLAAEMGPIHFYLDAQRITGRAGLFPARHQSDQVDRDGPLARRANRRLRAVLMQTAANLVHCNAHYRIRAERWQRQGKDERWIRVKVAKSFSRLLFVLVAGRQLVPHPALQPRTYLLGKLLKFHFDRMVGPAQMRADLEALCTQLPAHARAAEIPPLQERLNELSRRRGPQPLGDILPIVLARLQAIQSEPRHEDPR